MWTLRQIYTIEQGPSANHESMSDFVLAVKLVDGKGRVRNFDQHDPELAAVRACLGLCGVLFEITFAVGIQNGL